MAKVSRRTRTGAQPVRGPAPAVLIGKGVLLSLVVSLAAVTFLSVTSLTSESQVIDNYLRYIMVGVSVVSIFIGSAYAAHRAGGAGLAIGTAVGVIYVLISVGLGLELTGEAVSFFVLANKFTAGIAAGALGGLVGVNL